MTPESRTDYTSLSLPLPRPSLCACVRVCAHVCAGCKGGDGKHENCSSGHSNGNHTRHIHVIHLFCLSLKLWIDQCAKPTSKAQPRCRACPIVQWSHTASCERTKKESQAGPNQDPVPCYGKVSMNLEHFFIKKKMKEKSIKTWQVFMRRPTNRGKTVRSADSAWV